MIRRLVTGFLLLALAGCASHVLPPAPAAQTVIEVQILAINDFHGNIETPPEPTAITQADGTILKARVGGVAYDPKQPLDWKKIDRKSVV